MCPPIFFLTLPKMRRESLRLLAFSHKRNSMRVMKCASSFFFIP